MHLKYKHVFAIVLLLPLLLLSSCDSGPDPETERLKKELEEAQAANRRLSFYLVVALGVGGVATVFALQFFGNRRKTDETRPKVVVTTEVVRTPAHEVVADSFVIDGTNVVYGASTQTMSLLNLLGLLLELHRRRASYKCFFDANTFYAFERNRLPDQASEFRKLCRDFPDNFIEVPGGNRADDLILDFAHAKGTPIISNDRYRDYLEKYPWLSDGNHRRMSFAIHSGMIQIYPLGIQAPLPHDLDSGISSVRKSLCPQPEESGRSA